MSSMATSPTTLDVGRALARLDRYGSHAAGTLDIPTDIDGTTWTTREMIQSVARLLAGQMGATVRLRSVTTRDVAVIMAAHGLDAFVIDAHARRVASRVRACGDEFGRMSASI